MRPEFHFTVERGWVNDPHGITARDGEYHLFHQFVPDSMIWDANCHWGHAVGPDLFSLHSRAVVLAPGDGDDGVWSGALVTRSDGEARIFYTSTIAPEFGQGRIRSARPRDPDWDTWSKDEGVVVDPPDDVDVVTFRDPFVFRHDAEWHMLVGASLRGGIAAALLFTSPDLDDWTYAGVAASRPTTIIEPVWLGSLWECPQLFTIGDRHVLLTSVWDDDVLHSSGYGVGTYVDGRFHAEAWGRLSFGHSYYAPTFFRDAQGNPCLSFWMRGVRDAEAGWSGAHSVPHRLSLRGDVLVAVPHPDLERYASPSEHGERVSGHALLIDWTPGREDRLVVSHGGLQTLRIEAMDASLVVFGVGDASPMPYLGGDVRVVVDGPTVEVSTAGGVLGVPISATSTAIEVRSATGSTMIRALSR